MKTISSKIGLANTSTPANSSNPAPMTYALRVLVYHRNKAKCKLAKLNLAFQVGSTVCFTITSSILRRLENE